MIAEEPEQPPVKRPDPMVRFGEFLRERFSLAEDKDDEAGVIESISRGIKFKGINLWTLIFAMFLCSLPPLV